MGTCDLLAGYQDEYPLTEAEISLLPALIVNRIAMSLVISEWRASEHPENREYILGSVEKTWTVLKDIVRSEYEHSVKELIDYLKKT